MNHGVMVKVRNLHFGYNSRNILTGVSLEVFPGEILVIVGPSGSGKSTLLKLCAGLFYPKDGDVQVKGLNIHNAPKDDVRRLREKIGFVFQDGALISNTCILDNIALPLRYHTRLSESEIEKSVSRKMELLQIDRTYDYLLPAQLSLGIKKKVCFARALVMEPDIIFYDELTAGLDAQDIQTTTGIIKDLKDVLNVTYIIASGDISLASSIADRVATLKNGKIIETVRGMG